MNLSLAMVLFFASLTSAFALEKSSSFAGLETLAASISKPKEFSCEVRSRVVNYASKNICFANVSCTELKTKSPKTTILGLYCKVKEDSKACPALPVCIEEMKAAVVLSEKGGKPEFDRIGSKASPETELDKKPLNGKVCTYQTNNKKPRAMIVRPKEGTPDDESDVFCLTGVECIEKGVVDPTITVAACEPDDIQVDSKGQFWPICPMPHACLTKEPLIKVEVVKMALAQSEGLIPHARRKTQDQLVEETSPEYLRQRNKIPHSDDAY